MIRAAALIAASAMLALAVPAQATSSGTIRLQGAVQVDCTVSVTDNAVALNLVGGESNRTVGQVVETCNSGTGYTIAVSSANTGKLRDGKGNQIGYGVKYDGNAGTLVQGLAVSRNGAQFRRAANLTVSVDPSDQYIAGSYTDIVTIAISAR